MRMKIATSQMTNFGCMVWAVELKQGISVEEASGHIQAATPVLGWETVALGDALGRVVAESMISTRELPPADCSAMDGYAVHSADLVDATDAEPVDLSVVEEIPAGGDFRAKASAWDFGSHFYRCSSSKGSRRSRPARGHPRWARGSRHD